MGAVSKFDSIREIAKEVGFDEVGFAPLQPPRAAEKFLRWLDAGHHGGMEWLVRQKERIVDPAKVFGAGGTVISVGLGHARAPIELEGGGRIARYAGGRDYHNKLGRMLRKLGKRLVQAGISQRYRTAVDAAPLLERSHAAEAGLGFESKSANLLHRRWGPWLFLGELLVDIEYQDEGAGPAPGSCGTCTACIDACPTDAIPAAGVVDARKCISYLTIELRGAVPPALREASSEWAFGCDICSEVCPWGNRAPDASARYGTHARIESGNLIDWLSPRSEDQFKQEFNGSPLQRPKADGLRRNAAVAMARQPSEESRDALRAALTHDDSVIVRDAAAWSLERAHAQDAGVRGLLRSSLSNDPERAALTDGCADLSQA